jgi:putative transposase
MPMCWVPAPGWLETNTVLRVFSDERTTAVTGYRHFVAEGVGAASPWQGLKGQIYLGSDQFAARMQARIDPARPLREVPKRQRRVLAKPLADYADHWPDRDRAMAEVHRTGAYSMQGIADYFGISRMTVSRAVKRHEDVSATPNVTCESWPRLQHDPVSKSVPSYDANPLSEGDQNNRR